jgi:hypothetical protein
MAKQILFFKQGNILKKLNYFENVKRRKNCHKSGFLTNRCTGQWE